MLYNCRKHTGLVTSLFFALVAGCDASNSMDVEQPSPGLVVNAPPQISGSPNTVVLVGDEYSFMPDAHDADGDSLAFSITNLPEWARFDETNGLLFGAPDAEDIGVSEPITIQVSDGMTTSSLPAFSITVTQVQGSGLEPESPIEILALNTFELSEGATSVPIGAILETALPPAISDTSTLSAQLIDRGSKTASTARASISPLDSNKLRIDPDFDLIPNLNYQLFLSDGSAEHRINFSTSAVNWHAGGYILLAVDQAVNASSAAISSPSADLMDGIAIRVSWPSLEDDDGNYDFTPLTRALEQTALAGKKASISLFALSQSLDEPALARPQREFFATNLNPNSQGAGSCSRVADPFDDNFRGRYFKYLHALGAHLRENPELNDTVTYVIGAGDMTTRNWAYGAAFQSLFTDAECTQPISWEAAGFTVESMTRVLQESVAVFAEAFPDKVQWLSMGDMRLDDTVLSCGSRHCVSTELTAWALTNYPNRIGMWREDLNANRGAPASGSLWSEISRRRPRIGAQMVWNAQGCDVSGTGNCRLAADGTPKDVAMREALYVGLSNDTLSGYGHYLMNYVEVYAADTQDDELAPVFQDVQESVGWRSDTTPPSTPINVSVRREGTDTVLVSWSPSTDRWDSESLDTDNTLPVPDLTTSQSVTYRIVRDGTLLGTSGTTEFVDSDPTPSVSSYAVMAVDAAGNQSGESELVELQN